MLVHYLNVPSLEDSGKCSPLLCTVASRHDSATRWSRDDLLSQLKPMCKGDAHSDGVHVRGRALRVVLPVLSLSPQYEMVGRRGRVRHRGLGSTHSGETESQTTAPDTQLPLQHRPRYLTCAHRGHAVSAPVDLRASVVSSGVNIPHRCNNTKHRIISPKLPSSSCTPPPPELGEAGRDATGGDAQLPRLHAQSSPASSPRPPV